jgi:hypothetical protein
MTFDQWWYDYRIKNGISGEAVAKLEVARHAWAAATIASARPEEKPIVASICELDGCCELRRP